MSTLELTTTVLDVSQMAPIGFDNPHVISDDDMLPDVAEKDVCLASAEMQRRELDAQIAITSERIALGKEKKQQAAALEESRKALRDVEANRVKLLTEAKKEEEKAADARRKLAETEQVACAQAKQIKDVLREQTAKLQAAEQRDREEIAQAKREYQQNVAAMKEKAAQAQQAQLMFEANRAARETSEANLAKVMEQVTKSAETLRDLTLLFERQVAADNGGRDARGRNGTDPVGANASNNDDDDNNTDAQGDDDGEKQDSENDDDDDDNSDEEENEDDEESDDDEPNQSDVVTRRGKRHRRRITETRRGAKKAKYDVQRGAKILKMWAPIGIDIYSEATAAEKALLRDVTFFHSESDETGAAASTAAIDREFRNLIRAGKVTETAAMSKLAALVAAHVRVSKTHSFKSEPIDFGSAASDIVTAGLVVTALNLPIAVIVRELMGHFPRRSVRVFF